MTFVTKSNGKCSLLKQVTKLLVTPGFWKKKRKKKPFCIRSFNFSGLPHDSAKKYL